MCHSQLFDLTLGQLRKSLGGFLTGLALADFCEKCLVACLELLILLGGVLEQRLCLSELLASSNQIPILFIKFAFELHQYCIDFDILGNELLKFSLCYRLCLLNLQLLFKILVLFFDYEQFVNCVLILLGDF